MQPRGQPYKHQQAEQDIESYRTRLPNTSGNTVKSSKMPSPAEYMKTLTHNYYPPMESVPYYAVGGNFSAPYAYGNPAYGWQSRYDVNNSKDVSRGSVAETPKTTRTWERENTRKRSPEITKPLSSRAAETSGRSAGESSDKGQAFWNKLNKLRQAPEHDLLQSRKNVAVSSAGKPSEGKNVGQSYGAVNSDWSKYPLSSRQSESTHQKTDVGAKYSDLEGKNASQSYDAVYADWLKYRQSRGQNESARQETGAAAKLSDLEIYRRYQAQLQEQSIKRPGADAEMKDARVGQKMVSGDQAFSGYSVDRYNKEAYRDDWRFGSGKDGAFHEGKTNALMMQPQSVDSRTPGVSFGGKSEEGKRQEKDEEQYLRQRLLYGIEAGKQNVVNQYRTSQSGIEGCTYASTSASNPDPWQVNVKSTKPQKDEFQQGLERSAHAVQIPAKGGLDVVSTAQVPEKESVFTGMDIASTCRAVALAIQSLKNINFQKNTASNIEQTNVEKGATISDRGTLPAAGKEVGAKNLQFDSRGSVDVRASGKIVIDYGRDTDFRSQILQANTDFYEKKPLYEVGRNLSTDRSDGQPTVPSGDGSRVAVFPKEQQEAFWENMKGNQYVQNMPSAGVRNENNVKEMSGKKDKKKNMQRSGDVHQDLKKELNFLERKKVIQMARLRRLRRAAKERKMKQAKAQENDAERSGKVGKSLYALPHEDSDQRMNIKRQTRGLRTDEDLPSKAREKMGNTDVSFSRQRQSTAATNDDVQKFRKNDSISEERRGQGDVLVDRRASTRIQSRSRNISSNKDIDSRRSSNGDVDQRNFLEVEDSPRVDIKQRRSRGICEEGNQRSAQKRSRSPEFGSEKKGFKLQGKRIRPGDEIPRYSRNVEDRHQEDSPNRFHDEDLRQSYCRIFKSHSFAEMENRRYSKERAEHQDEDCYTDNIKGRYEENYGSGVYGKSRYGRNQDVQLNKNVKERYQRGYNEQFSDEFSKEDYGGEDYHRGSYEASFQDRNSESRYQERHHSSDDPEDCIQGNYRNSRFDGDREEYYGRNERNRCSGDDHWEQNRNDSDEYDLVDATDWHQGFYGGRYIKGEKNWNRKIDRNFKDSRSTSHSQGRHSDDYSDDFALRHAYEKDQGTNFSNERFSHTKRQRMEERDRAHSYAEDFEKLQNPKTFVKDLERCEVDDSVEGFLPAGSRRQNYETRQTEDPAFTEVGAERRQFWSQSLFEPAHSEAITVDVPRKPRFRKAAARKSRRLLRLAHRQKFLNQGVRRRFFTKQRKFFSKPRMMAENQRHFVSKVPELSGELQDIIKDVICNVQEAKMVDPVADAELYESLSWAERKQVQEIQEMTGIECVTVIVTAMRMLWELEPKVVRTLGNLEPELIKTIGDER